MKEVTAQTNLEVMCSCPYCNAFLDILDNDEIRESLSDNDFSAEDCNVEVSCSECDQKFLVTDIFY